MKKLARMIIAIGSVIGLCVPFLTPLTAHAVPNCSAGKTINIVAHADDDLLFINPDVQGDIDNGKCVRTVYVTASDGNAGLAHAEAREEGVRDAYAYMVGVSNAWSTTSITVNGYSMQQSTLIGNDRISLIFMRLPDGDVNGGGMPSNSYQSLYHLWYGINNTSSISPIDSTATYTKQQLVDTLHALMSSDSSDTIRTLNFVSPYDSSDHSDHKMVGFFAKEAHQYYTIPHQFIGYRGYDVASENVNLASSDATQKQNTYVVYDAHDGSSCQNSAQCTASGHGDYPLFWGRKYQAGVNTRSTESFDTMEGSTNSLSGVTGATGKTPAATTFGGSIYSFYYDQTNGRLRYAKASSPTSPVWSFATLDSSSSNVGQNPTAAVFNSRLYVFYYDAANQNLREADSADGVSWSYHNIDTTGNTGLTPTAVVYGGYLRVFYYDQTNGNLKQGHLDNASGNWYYTTIEGDGGAVIAAGSSHADSTCYGDIGIDPVAVEYNSTLQIFSYDTTNGNLHHTWYDGSNWNCEKLDGYVNENPIQDNNGRVDANVGFNPSTAVYNGVLQVFYYDQTNGNLRHAFSDANGWHFEMLDGDGYSVTRHDANTGATPNVVVQGSILHVFATDVTRGDVRHYWASTTQGWQSEVLDGSGDDGSAGRTNSSTGEDPYSVNYGTNLHVFYYESGDTNLRHATL